ncbi:hypothetical protein ACE3LL_16360 [Enterobacter hormaechei subsp. steigerwaltii]|uniref:hypothetical protein n=1 Tax=Enterobacter hormaechei TaxID=158836 RepID=UPI0035C562F2
MKTFTIGWLNKCRCGNKSHSVKTARGNESALWDDDAVKCNSCGRGGVIQVCEGQARVLWETDEEMAEGKPMSTITKEQVQSVSDLKAGYTLGHADVAILNELARIALASLEAEAVGEVVLGEYDDCGCHPDARVACIAADGQADWENFKDGTRLYTAPPAPVALPDERYQQLSELYHAQEKRLFKLAQRIKGSAFDKYAHSPSQAIDVLESALFGESDDTWRAAMLQVAEPVTMAYKLPAIGWLRADYQDDNRGLRGNAPLFVLGKKDPSTVWGLDYIPLTSNSSVIPDGVCPCCGRKPLKNRTCSVSGCDGKHVARGFCIKHYAIERKKDPSRRESIRAADKRYRARKAAAPQQEISHALAKGMERYGDAMQELAKKEVK